jgi:hypothetical protein
MAWIDDRVWCHPKVTDVSVPARWIWVASIAYSAGMQTGGTLTAGQQSLIGSSAKIRRELVAVRLWDDVDGKSVQVHDWDNHNGKRDDQRAQARDRKRKQRDRERDVTRDKSVTNGVTWGGTDSVTSRERGRASREGSEGSDRKPRAVTSQETPHANGEQPSTDDIDFNILKAVDW